MSGKQIWDWNIVIVEKHSFPRKPQQEFQVSSKSIAGAATRARNIIKQDFPEWQIKSIWWLDPKRAIRSF